MGSSELEDALAFQMAAVGLPAPLRQYKFAKHLPEPRFWSADFAWPDMMILVEVDGGSWITGRHTRGAGFENDCEKVSTAAAMGWHVLRFTGNMINDGRALCLIEMALGMRQA